MLAWFDEYREKAAEYPAMAMVGPGDPNILQIKLGVLGRLGLFLMIEGSVFYFRQKKEVLEGKVLNDSRKSKI